MWASVADVLLALNATITGPHFDQRLRLQFFLQNWKINASSSSQLPSQLRNLIVLARKYRANFGAIHLSPNLRAQMPIWLHIGIAINLKHLNARKEALCLRTTHHITTVDQLDTFVEYGNMQMDPTTKHFPKRFCCNGCATIREIHACPHPYKCYQLATSLRTNLGNKWDPSGPANTDNLSLTPRRKKKNNRHRDFLHSVTFNPSITVHDDLSLSFRLFADASEPCLDTALRP
ncbi:hypothetical protein BDW22DRAFT_1337903, partial [Trametopsis cervina]